MMDRRVACGDGTASGQHLAAFTAILCCCFCVFGRLHLEKRRAPERIKAQRRQNDFFLFSRKLVENPKPYTGGDGRGRGGCTGSW